MLTHWNSIRNDKEIFVRPRIYVVVATFFVFVEFISKGINFRSEKQLNLAHLYINYGKLVPLSAKLPKNRGATTTATPDDGRTFYGRQEISNSLLLLHLEDLVAICRKGWKGNHRFTWIHFHSWTVNCCRIIGGKVAWRQLPGRCLSQSWSEKNKRANE